MADLIELAERCERGSGPDRELDWVIAHAVRGEPAHNPGFPLQWLDEDELPAFTSSLDASVALLERVLPGCGFTISKHSNVVKPKAVACVEQSEEDWTYEGWPNASAATPARALLAAILRALSEKGRG